MIVCLEGPSAVGKTTTCQALAAQGNASTIPEVNALFERPATEPLNWYLERQLARWEIARRQSLLGNLALLDGDPFQPLWYNWSYDFHNLQTLDELSAFYRPRLAAGLIDFPDRYVCLLADEAELRHRKASDTTRPRRDFEAHLRLTQTQPRYFEVLSHLAPGKVCIVNAESVEANVRRILEYVAAFPCREVNSLDLFDCLIDWLKVPFKEPQNDAND